ncbi:DUF1792 domain-containing protein [bacterium C-53]|nr:DUF1792 domain-containing protein [Lachnospiraceae bacterium]NBI04684.1 DUF1792 domain-containing protein [Lachnospiraceae bacterium]RKJ07906.1 DUF1792 domain-containing protein [bacterium C-53]
MKKIYIFGVGKGKEIVRENLIEENVELLGYIDNNASAYSMGVDGKKVLRIEEAEEEFDYILVSVMRYRFIDEQLAGYGIVKEKIIHFFSFDDAVKEEYWCILKKSGWILEAMSYEFRKKVRPYSQNLVYELADQRNEKPVIYPKILPSEEAVELICNEKKSLARFGADEFELMKMRNRSRYQLADRKLGERLSEVIKSQQETIIIAIADNYGSLDAYTQEAAEDIREYLSLQVRREHMELLDLKKTYYDAYLSRPYIIYKDKDAAGKRFEALKQIWKGKNILIVEGFQTRMGVGNDLFDNTNSIRRIVAPSENAYGKYNEILTCVKNTAKDELILIALGATATVLAYDLALNGLWAVDIGHIDLEYEWYCSGIKQTYDIPYKYVNEVNKGNQVCDLPCNLKEKYESEIVCNLS